MTSSVGLHEVAPIVLPLCLYQQSFCKTVLSLLCLVMSGNIFLKVIFVSKCVI